MKFDVQLKTDPTSKTELKLIEFKSFKSPSDIPLDQFLNYIAQSNSPSQFEYNFDANKLDVDLLKAEEQARKGMRTFVKTNRVGDMMIINELCFFMLLIYGE